MRETRPSGSEGGEAGCNRPFLPLSATTQTQQHRWDVCATHFKSGFTLVELLVVIGIIAVLIGILLPVVARVRESGRSAACLANLRSIGQLLRAYQAEQKDFLPYGMIWARANFQTGQPIDTTLDSSRSQWWSSQVSAMGIKNNVRAGAFSPTTYSLILKCPSADSDIFTQSVHYMAHPVAMPSVRRERLGVSEVQTTGSTRTLISPARSRDLFTDNMLVWDAPLTLSLGGDNTGQPGYDWSFIDNGALADPNDAWRRYRFTPDPYEGGLGLEVNDPISIEPPDNNQYVNTDSAKAVGPGTFDVDDNEQVGTMRWRHRRGTTGNGLMSDGSVSTWTWDRNARPFGEVNTAGSDLLRRHIKLKPPSGVEHFYDVSTPP
jgi:prepilin-type N-terminal cleavage/methylation domain-containing protein